MNRADGVLHVAERPGLHPVAVDLDRRAREGACDETRDHHPVLPLLPRADRVEKARDNAVELAFLVEGEREELVHGFRVGVEPPAFGHRTVHPPVPFLERAFFAVIAVDLGARRDEHSLAELRAVLEHDLRPLDVRDHGEDGLLDDQPDSHGRGEVVDDVALVDELADHRAREHRLDDEVELRIVEETLDVSVRPRRDVVECVDLPALVEQELGKM